MKKAGIMALAIIAVIMASFTAGFYMGRNSGTASVEISPQRTFQDKVLSSSADENDLPTEPSDDTVAVTISAEPTTDNTGAAADTDTESRKININTASASQLAELPGIGEVIAQRIVEYREANGPFASLDELDNVEGIGPGRLDGISEAATVGG